MAVGSKITLIRAARELLGWNQHVLAEKACVHVITVRRYERGETVQEESVKAIRGALNTAGVVFLGADSDVSAISEGVALHAPRSRETTFAPPAGPQTKTTKAARSKVDETSRAKRPRSKV